jgi:hypothetical protein
MDTAPREPLIDYPAPPDHLGSDDDCSDAPYDDPGATDAVRFAGCSMETELDQLGAITNV